MSWSPWKGLRFAQRFHRPYFWELLLLSSLDLQVKCAILKSVLNILNFQWGFFILVGQNLIMDILYGGTEDRFDQNGSWNFILNSVFSKESNRFLCIFWSCSSFLAICHTNSVSVLKLNLVLLFLLQSEKCLVEEIWGNHQVPLICFSSLRWCGPPPPVVKCLKIVWVWHSFEFSNCSPLKGKIHSIYYIMPR